MIKSPSPERNLDNLDKSLIKEAAVENLVSIMFNVFTGELKTILFWGLFEYLVKDYPD